MSTRIRLSARMPPLIKATTSIRVVTGRFMASTVGFINYSIRRLGSAPLASASVAPPCRKGPSSVPGKRSFVDFID